MKIFINSRKVDSYKLIITDGYRELFNGLMFSNPKWYLKIIEEIGDEKVS